VNATRENPIELPTRSNAVAEKVDRAEVVNMLTELPGQRPPA